MKKVVKFGGSSLASAEQFKKVGNIIRKEESRRYVIPSAPGKRTPDDTKVTDMLYSCYGQARTVPELRARAKELGLRGYSKLRKDELIDLIRNS